MATHARHGHGTYVRDGFIYASLLGKAHIEREIVSKDGSKSSGNSQQSHQSSMPIVSVKSLKDNLVVIPHIGSLVIAKVTLTLVLPP